MHPLYAASAAHIGSHQETNKLPCDAARCTQQSDLGLASDETWSVVSQPTGFPGSSVGFPTSSRSERPPALSTDWRWRPLATAVAHSDSNVNIAVGWMSGLLSAWDAVLSVNDVSRFIKSPTSCAVFCKQRDKLNLSTCTGSAYICFRCIGTKEIR